MRSPRLGAIVIALVLLASSGATGACTIVGPLLGPGDFGIPAGQVLADTSATLLPDGRVRMYIFGQGRGVVSPTGGWRLHFTSGGGIRSAVSTDGLNFTVEEGFRITAEMAAFAGTGCISATCRVQAIRPAGTTSRARCRPTSSDGRWRKA